MRALIQRVRRASVSVAGERVGAIDRGFLVFLGVRKGDSLDTAPALAAKVSAIRVFNDAAGKMNLSLADVGGSVLVVSQMTLYGDCSRGRRPSFDDVAGGPEAEPLYESFVAALRSSGLNVETGVFGGMMDVELVNEGPATFLVEL